MLRGTAINRRKHSYREKKWYNKSKCHANESDNGSPEESTVTHKIM
jgi:hypothetical protein